MTASEGIGSLVNSVAVEEKRFALRTNAHLSRKSAAKMGHPVLLLD
jgi:hypothetical protein